MDIQDTANFVYYTVTQKNESPLFLGITFETLTDFNFVMSILNENCCYCVKYVRFLLFLIFL